VSLNGRFVAGSAAVAAEAPLASDNDTPINPKVGATSLRDFRLDACFAFGIWNPSIWTHINAAQRVQFHTLEDYRIAAKRTFWTWSRAS
jgi:hypothetical protein